MDIDYKKELIIKAGLELVESGLIARTYGNISCRLDDNYFLITPSGRDYKGLTNSEIVKIDMKDTSYEGNIKPSSEKTLHAEVYKLRPGINFVIHTHQKYASVLSVLNKESINIGKNYPCLSSEIPYSSYALSGTKELAQNIKGILESSLGKAIIMKNHGALLMGKDYEETFQMAYQLEKASYEYIVKEYSKHSGSDFLSIEEMADFALSKYHKKNEILDTSHEYSSSKRADGGFLVYHGAKNPVYYKSDDKGMGKELGFYSDIYNRYEDINYIVFKDSPEIKALSRYGVFLKALLDDFAQAVGISMKTVEEDSREIIDALGDSSAVFLKNHGALSCGETEDDAISVSMIVEKSSMAYIIAALFGEISFIEDSKTSLMRDNYLKNYSKLK